MGRFILAILAGFLAYVVVATGIETLGHQIYPAAQSVDFGNPEVAKSYMEKLPFAAKLFVLVAWCLGSMAAGFTSGSITKIRHALAAIILGGLVVCGVILITMMIPHPVWMIIVGLLTPIPFALLGNKLAKKPR